MKSITHQTRFDQTRRSQTWRSESRRSRGVNRIGFTLVEMLVVIAIIGILAAVLVPVIGGAMRTAREAAIKSDLSQIVTAIEGYKAKTNAYPADFGNPYAIYPHIGKHSSRLGNPRGYIDTVSSTPGILDNPGSGWYGTNLVNPHRGPGGLSETVTGTPGGIATRRPNTIDAAESWVFWMYETTNNPAYPLGAVWNASTSTWVVDPQWTTVWDPNRFMEFDPARFSDRDADGWFEYLPPGSDEQLLPPYVYFDSRTYFYQNANAGAVVNVRRNSVFPPLYAPQNATPPPSGLHVGICQPFVETFVSAANYKWYEVDKYQIICSGLDDHFSEHDVVAVQYDWTDAASFKVVPGKSQPVGRNIDGEDRDNIVSFLNDRVDLNEE